MKNLALNIAEKGDPRSESIRLFKNNIMEWFTHIHPLSPHAVWLPVIAFFYWRSFVLHKAPFFVIFAMGVLGLLSWTLFEYLMHRYLFHFRAKNRVGKYIAFLFHGIHHQTPRDKTRLVIPPSVSALVGVLFYLALRFLVPEMWLDAFFPAMALGYILYDSIHYSIHHFSFESIIGKYVQRVHLEHHYKDAKSHFGVSSPLWDFVFGTLQSK